MLNYWNAMNQVEIAKTRLIGSRLRAHYPNETNCTATDCGWDEFTQSAKNTGCLTCHGKGKVSHWQTYYFRARVQWHGAVQLSFVAPTSGIEKGDLTLAVATQDKELMERVLVSDRAYITVEDKTVRPTVIQRLDVPTVGEEYQVVCNLYNPNE
ncbi:hypothetical protein ANRL1_03570 [Anaerolineae bacterium]|nr:hypothetical protein ANRL1_03570 [Anaerolineae bacterium]